MPRKRSVFAPSRESQWKASREPATLLTALVSIVAIAGTVVACGGSSTGNPNWGDGGPSGSGDGSPPLGGSSGGSGGGLDATALPDGTTGRDGSVAGDGGGTIFYTAKPRTGRASCAPVGCAAARPMKRSATARASSRTSYPATCGTCGHACAPNEACSAGVCSAGCTTPTNGGTVQIIKCGQLCVDRWKRQQELRGLRDRLHGRGPGVRRGHLRGVSGLARRGREVVSGWRAAHRHHERLDQDVCRDAGANHVSMGHVHVRKPAARQLGTALGAGPSRAGLPCALHRRVRQLQGALGSERPTDRGEPWREWHVQFGWSRRQQCSGNVHVPDGTLVERVDD